jgi:hypothetical protein
MTGKTGADDVRAAFIDAAIEADIFIRLGRNH